MIPHLRFQKLPSGITPDHRGSPAGRANPPVPLDHFLAVDAVIHTFTWMLECQRRVGCSAHGTAAELEYSQPHSRPMSSSSTQYLTAIQIMMTTTVKLQTLVITMFSALSPWHRDCQLYQFMMSSSQPLSTLLFLSPISYLSETLRSWPNNHLWSSYLLSPKLIFFTKPFLHSSSTFPPTGLTPWTPAVFCFS